MRAARDDGGVAGRGRTGLRRRDRSGALGAGLAGPGLAGPGLAGPVLAGPVLADQGLASRRRLTPASAGFTLLEILVALAVFGFLLVGLSQTVRFGLTAWRQDARLSDGKTDLEAVDRTLRSVVTNLAPSDDGGGPSINGSAATLSGITRLRVPGSGTTPVRVEAGLAVSGGRLVLRWRLFHHAVRFGPPVRPAETELLAGVSRLRIGYWQPSGVWTASWHQPDLPLLIRFQVILAGEHAPRWPDIVVAPLLSRP